MTSKRLSMERSSGVAESHASRSRSRDVKEEESDAAIPSERSMMTVEIPGFKGSLPSQTDPLSGDIFAIGDIHGCYEELQALLSLMSVTPTDTVITLGDLVDRGPDVKAVLDWLISRPLTYNTIGNHDYYFIDYVFNGRSDDNEYMLTEGLAATIYQLHGARWNMTYGQIVGSSAMRRPYWKRASRFFAIPMSGTSFATRRIHGVQESSSRNAASGIDGSTMIWSSMSCTTAAQRSYTGIPR